ncbi:hypothetical protein RHAB15C_0001403 (plasmid) [Candidatus Rhabdochlamydia porcellionis]|uniref:Mobile element protein n=1 Tax=Candidatus Rhabdochlamydia porcellionis TaxID=225148 RepID=A0ABX8Z1A9_9BACT|nr:hypothetical protein RHAB15C_0001403 [Candidatus Rhabdochlamydia porcellionis]
MLIDVSNALLQLLNTFPVSQNLSLLRVLLVSILLLIVQGLSSEETLYKDHKKIKPNGMQTPG